jgi:hypothetical protein
MGMAMLGTEIFSATFQWKRRPYYWVFVPATINLSKVKNLAVILQKMLAV